jgi:hypothetical protein
MGFSEVIMRSGAFLYLVKSVVLAGGALLIAGCFTGEGGAENATEQQLIKDKDKDPGCGDVCVTELLGDGATCQLYTDIKTQAAAFCEAQARVLTNLIPVTDCGDGSAASQVEVTCCSPAAPPPEPANVCVGELLGDGVTCVSPADLKEQAHQVCEAQGLVLVDMSLSLDCPDSFSTYAKVFCCESAPPPPPPPPEPTTCSYAALGDGSTCETDEAWKLKAIADCEAQGLVLVDIAFAKDCPGGGSGYIKYACCEPE